MIRRVLCNLAVALTITWLALAAAAMTFAYITDLTAQYSAAVNLE